MQVFLVVLVLGFIFNSLSASTTWLCRRLGERNGRWATFLLRNVLGIPLWTVGLALAVRTHSERLFAPSVNAEIVGWFLLALGCVLMVMALGALRGRAAMPSTSDQLIQHGPYAYVRHPIHVGLLLSLMALVLIRPTQTAALADAIGVVWVVVQSRLEEIDLVQRIPAYRGYLSRVPRFIPRMRRRSA
jgi:protein-S-isoprenylcysteine O-methyltransferase Ste14